MKSFSETKQEYLSGLKSLLAPNAILIILFNCTNQYGNYMASGIIGKFALNTLNVSAAAVGICASIYSLGGMLFRGPSGKLVDERDPKRVLLLALCIKMLTFALYGFIPEGSVVLLGIVRFVHGVTWSFIGVCGPAMITLYIDRAAIGSAYALFLGIQQIVTGSARAVSITAMSRFGPTAAFLICAAETLVPILFVSLMQPKAKAQAVRRKAEKPKAEGAPAPRKGSMVCWRLVPLCLMSSLPMMTYAAENTFLPALCESRGLEYLATLTMATSLSGVVSVIVGILCDIVDPYILCIFTLLTNGLGLFLIGRAGSTGLLTAAFFLYYTFGKSFNAPFTVQGMKSIRQDEAGSFSGTNLFIDDLFTLISGSATGILANLYGLGTSFQIIGLLPLLGVVLMLTLKRKIAPPPL